MKVKDHPRVREIVDASLIDIECWKNAPQFNRLRVLTVVLSRPTETLYILWDMKRGPTAIYDDDIISFSDYCALQLGG